MFRPWPPFRESQCWCAGAVHDDSGERDELGASGSVGGRGLVGEQCGPASEVVGEHGTAEPCGVGWVVPGGDVFESGAFFEVADGELDDGVFSVELVGFDHRHIGVGGDEGVVSPVRPQAALVLVGEPGSAHNEADAAGFVAAADGVDRFRNLGLAAKRVVDEATILLQGKKT